VIIWALKENEIEIFDRKRGCYGTGMEDYMENTADRTIITVVGKDTVGIIAKVCTYLSENQINVLDISQTIVSGYFNMMMIVDMNQSTRSFADCQKELDGLGEQIGVSIKCQRAEIFEKMHRI
jgi:ACT domain-containing protein